MPLNQGFPDHGAAPIWRRTSTTSSSRTLSLLHDQGLSPQAQEAGGAGKLNFHEVVEFGHYASMAAFADPEVQQALLTLMFAGEQAVEWQRNSRPPAGDRPGLSDPSGFWRGQNAPYDMLADNIRGF